MNVEQRLARLERENRLLKGCGLAVLVGLACVGLLAADKSDPKEITADVITAKTFKLEDGSGPTGKWYINPEKGPILVMEWNRGKDNAETQRKSIFGSDTLWFTSKQPGSNDDNWISVDAGTIQFFDHARMKKSISTYGFFGSS
jgi:hypothetical protein